MPRIATMLMTVLALMTLPVSGQTPPQADDLARRLQAHYDTVRSFSADFTQTYEGGLLNLPATERGTLKLKKPGRFRMEYAQPERKLFVSDGAMAYSYFPADKIVSRDPVPTGDEASTALQFLAGSGNLPRDFTARMAERQPEREWRLELTPKTPTADFTTLILMVDRQSLALRGFGWTDDQGGTTITRLANLRENASIADREFEFTIPPGVVIRR